MDKFSKSACLFTVFFIIFLAKNACGKKCTNVLSRNEIHEVTIGEPCTEKYEARCGWLSLDYCTFYRQTTCKRQQNQTATVYYIQTICCEGYYMSANGTCIKKVPGVVYKPVDTLPSAVGTGDPHYVAPLDTVKVEGIKTKDTVEISGGGWAGIVCGMVFLLCVTGFIIRAVRKRKIKLQEHKGDSRRKVTYVGQSSSAEISPLNGNVPSPQLSIQADDERRSRAATPSSSRMITPPSSPTTEMQSVGATGTVSFMVSNKDEMDAIPETDI